MKVSTKLRRWGFSLLLLLLLTACPQTEKVTGDFSVVLEPEHLVLTPGHSAEIEVQISRKGGFSDPINLDIKGLPADVSASFSQTSVTGDSSILTLTTTATTTAIKTPFSVTATAPGHEQVAEAQLSVQVPSDPQPGLEEYAPGVNGVITTLTVNGQEITYEVINGLAIAGGDMILGGARALANQAEQGLDTSSATCNFGFHTGFACASWQDGVIGYTFANDWGSEAENERMRNLIEQAIDQWEQNTGIRFVRRASGQYLEFRDGSGCSSGVGRVEITGFDSQSISLSNTGCDNLNSILHEIGHAIGLYHEHQRNDRDDYVVVDFGRIQDFHLHDFMQIGDFMIDTGPYDYASVMHYPKWAFARNKAACKAGDLGECTIRPKNGINPDFIGEQPGLSDGDIVGVYTLYPAQFTIGGIGGAGHRSDHYNLFVDFSTPGVDASAIHWKSNRVSAELGTGYTLELIAGDLPEGEHTITVDIVIHGTTVASESTTLSLDNSPPTVEVEPSGSEYTQDLNNYFTITSTVYDSEDDGCSPDVCTYTWSPTPTASPFNSTVAHYRFDTVGRKDITLTVEDSGGGVDDDSLSVFIVNTPPEADIIRPASSVSRASGTVIGFKGTAGDINSDTGRLPCTALSWISSDPSDIFSGDGCLVSVTLGDAGARTITLTATDPQGAQDTAELAVTATACEGNCQPSVYFDFTTPADFSGAGGIPGYFFITAISMTGSVDDVDVDTPISYRWEVIPPCGSGCAVLLESGTLSDLSSDINLTWTPEDFISGSCSDYYDQTFTLVLSVTDSRGAVNSYQRDFETSCYLI